MTRRSRNRACVLYLTAALGLMVGLSPAEAQNPPGPASKASVPGASDRVAKIESIAQGKTMLRVHLAIDGNLPGKVVRPASPANSVPGKAKVSLTAAKHLSLRVKVWFLQNGQVVNEVKTDESGRFQVLGLRPGVYSVVAMGRDAAGIVPVELLPYQPNLAKEMTVLTIALAEPSEDGKPEEIRDLGYVPSTGETMAGYGGGAMGGGGGGMMALAGLAGLSGLAGIGGGGGYVGPASPNVP